jgi:integral membrane protein (TIGR01906 family)
MGRSSAGKPIATGYHEGVNGLPFRAAASVVVAAATILVLAGIGVALFFNPVFVAFEQDRSGAEAWTGFTPGQLHAATNQVLGELYFGPGTFAMTVDGAPLFDARERQHMVDVRGVFTGFAASVLGGGAVLAVAALAGRRKAWFWRGVAGGASALAVGVVVGGAVFVVAFDAAFEIFHRLFFAGGSYTFDPRTERLVQLFPEQFWSETSIAVAAAGLVLALVVARYARGRTRTLAASNPGQVAPGTSAVRAPAPTGERG